MKIFSLILLFLLGFSGIAQTKLGELNISTITSHGLILPNVTIELYLNDTILIKSTKTDANGRVQINDLIEGTYSLKASKEEYYARDHNVTIKIGQKNNVTIDLLNIEEERKRLEEERKKWEEESRCDYDMGIEKPICHICQSIINVIPYKKGLHLNKALRNEQAESQIYFGCVNRCVPRWYCKKDKVMILKQ